MDKYVTRDLTEHDGHEGHALLVDGKWCWRQVAAHDILHYVYTGTFYGTKLLEYSCRRLNKKRHAKLIAKIDAAYGGPAKTLGQQGIKVGFAV